MGKQEELTGPCCWPPGKLVVLGLGMNFKAGIEGYSSWFEEADIIVGSRALLQMMPNLAEKIITITTSLENLFAMIKANYAGKKVLFAASGDPLFHGIGRQVGQFFGPESLFIVPNISSIQYLFSKIGIPWDDVVTLSLHKEDSREFFYWLRKGKSVALLTSPKHNPSLIAELLVEYGIAPFVRMVIGERLGTPEERISFANPKEARQTLYKEPNLVALIPQIGLCVRRRILFREEEFLHERGMITKKEVRAVVLQALRLEEGDILWDLGAGSGSVSVEACYSKPLKAVHAVEKNDQRFGHLAANVRKFHCGEVYTHLGDILTLMKDLPKPAKIFIGGGGSGLGDILRWIHERFGGRVSPIVITAVVWASIEAAHRFSSEYQYDMSVSQIFVARSASTGTSFRLNGLNPVFVITLEHPIG